MAIIEISQGNYAPFYPDLTDTSFSESIFEDKVSYLILEIRRIHSNWATLKIPFLRNQDLSFQFDDISSSIFANCLTRNGTTFVILHQTLYASNQSYRVFKMSANVGVLSLIVKDDIEEEDIIGVRFMGISSHVVQEKQLDFGEVFFLDSEFLKANVKIEDFQIDNLLEKPYFSNIAYHSNASLPFLSNIYFTLHNITYSFQRC